MGATLINVSVPPLGSVEVGKLYGFFAFKCLTGSGYDEYQICGYSIASTKELFLKGYNNNTSFNEDGVLVITNPSTATSLNYTGLLFGVKK